MGLNKEGRKRFWEAFKPSHIPFSMPMHVTSVKTQKSTNEKCYIFKRDEDHKQNISCT